MNTDFDRDPPTVRIPCIGADHSDAFNADPGHFSLETCYFRDDVATLVCRCPECLTTMPVEVAL